MMSPVFCGIGCILIGVFFIGILAFGYIRNVRNGMKTLDGEIIAINHDTQTLRIRYKDKEQEYETDHHDLRCFATGIFPEIGLKVGVRVRTDSPSAPVSILLQRSSINGSRDRFIHCSRFHTILRLGFISGFFIFCGILFLTGQIT